jgi:thioredoxin-like negative regulator of GroEL
MDVRKIKSDDDFKGTISKGNSFIMIHKSGCPFCEKAMPWVSEVCAAGNSDVVIATANKDDIPKTMEVFQVSMYPTFVQIKDGKVLQTFFGDTVEDKVKDFLNCSFD